MIPRLHTRGKSFKGTLTYILHDPDRQQTDERVDWSMKQNLFCHIEDAWFEMLETYNGQEALKAAAGVDARGRKNTSPVLHYSLSWSPKESPSPEQMQAAALSSLKALGLSEHEAVIAGHSDKDHLHAHVVVNTVHPSTGRTAALKFNKLELSRWAEAYEKEHGLHCEVRVANNEDRRILKEQRTAEAQNILSAIARGDDYGDRASYVPIKDMSPNRKQWTRLKELENKVIAEAFAHLTEKNSTFTRAALAKQINKVAKDAKTFTALMARAEASPELVRMPGDEGRYSTKAMVDCERDIARFAAEMSERPSHIVVDPVYPKDGPQLSTQQLNAVAHLVQPEQLTSLVGYAGTGKSTLLGAAKHIWELEGYRVHGAAFSGIAAQSLQNGSGIESSTLHRMLGAIEKGKLELGAKDVIVVDEAGMVGSVQMAALLSAAHKAGSKVALVGDPDQLRPISGGAPFRAIIQRNGAATITEIRRQHIAWQLDASLDLAEGRTTRALIQYEDGGLIERHWDKWDAVNGVLAAWSSDRSRLQPGQTSMMLAGTNATVSQLNLGAREILAAEGKLGEVRYLNALEERIDKPRREFELEIAVGDQLMFTKNNYDLDVRNGTLGRVKGFDDGTIVMEIGGPDGRTISVDTQEYRNLNYGYALTVHKSQGVTVDRAQVLAEPSMDMHSAYVALTRHREGVQLHWAEEDFATRSNMMAMLSRDRLKDNTLDYVDPQQPSGRLSDRGGEALGKSISRDFSQASHGGSRSDEIRAEMREWTQRSGGQDFGLEL